MDKIKELANKAKSGSGSSSNNTGGAGGKEDYGDKGLSLREISQALVNTSPCLHILTLL